MTAYLNIFSCERTPLDDAGLRPGDHIHATLDGAVDEAEDRDYEYTVVIEDVDRTRETKSWWPMPHFTYLDLTPHVREKQAERRADERHNAGLRAGAGRVVL